MVAQPLSSARRVDYDRIAPTYDRRFAADRQEPIALALRALAGELGAGGTGRPARVLEVGCGTGRWLADLEPVTYQLYGLDLSTGMLQRAHGRSDGLFLVRGQAERLAFANAAFDLVYCVNALHHFDRPRAFVAEARRLLRPGGRLAVIGMDPRCYRGRWYAYRYFAGVLEADLRRFPSWGTVLDWMVAEGFVGVECRLVQRIVAPKVGRAVLDDPFLRKDACSQFVLLSERAYAAGLGHIEIALAEAEAAGEEIVFPVDLCLSMLTGQVPERG
jgi:ubiquinone/menaquinone biosynthesis C-methylase UbiE